MNRPQTAFETAISRYDVPPADDSPDQWGVQPKHLQWVTDFAAQHGRAPRVLGIGNIANNAFKNATALRDQGVECDVLCYGYFHIMACPEWEEAYFDADKLNGAAPVWSSVDLQGYERPRWFAQGNLGTAMDYLISLREQDVHTDDLWRKMSEERDVGGASPATAIYSETISQAEMFGVAEQVTLEFAARFPRRRDKLTAADILHSTTFGLPKIILGDLPRVRRLLSNYDFVIGYSIDGLFPLLAGVSRFIAFEHGTIRALPFERNLMGRLCALTYAMAWDVLLSNPDNILAAKRLNLQSYRFVPHAILETWRKPAGAAALRAKLLAQYDADFLVFHSSRQHWSAQRNTNWEKGNDILIRAFARFVKEQRPRALLLMVEWGATIAESKALIEELGIADRVVWLQPLPIRVMLDYIAASEVLADQFTIGGWGAIMPLGTMVGSPVLIYLSDSVHRWCFPKMPPFVDGESVETVFNGLVDLQDAGRLQAEAQAGSAWFDRYHSMSVVAGRLIDSLMACDADDAEFAAVVPDSLSLPAARQISEQLGRTALLADKVFDFTSAFVDDIGWVARVYGPADVVCYDYWRDAGASVQSRDNGALVMTPAQAWHYAAGIRLSYGGVDLNREQCWVRVRVTDVQGQMRVCLYKEADDAVVAEETLVHGLGVQEVMLKVDDAAATLLLFRSGDSDTSSSVVVIGAEVLASPDLSAGRSPARSA